MYYLDIQAISTLYAFYWFFMCWLILFINFYILKPLSWKVTFSGTQKPKAPQILDLQWWDLVHFEVEWSEYRELSLNNLSFNFLYEFKKFNFFNKFFKQCAKSSIKFILEGKWNFGIISYTLSRAKSNGSINFVLSLKLAEP